MEALAQFIAPLIGLWTIHSAIFMSAGFVNTMHETVISGFHNGKAITPAHQRAIVIDWVLCMAATVTVCVLFAGILISYSVEPLASARLMWIELAIGLYPIVCAILFLICSIADFRLMKAALAAAEAAAGAASSNGSRPRAILFARSPQASTLPEKPAGFLGHVSAPRKRGPARARSRW